MHPPTHDLTETGLGTPKERGGRFGRRVRAIVGVAVALVLVLLAAGAVAGPREALAWAAAYLVPVGALVCGIAVSLALLMWALEPLPEPPYRDWRQ